MMNNCPIAHISSCCSSKDILCRDKLHRHLHFAEYHLDVCFLSYHVVIGNVTVDAQNGNSNPLRCQLTWANSVEFAVSYILSFVSLVVNTNCAYHVIKMFFQHFYKRLCVPRFPYFFFLCRLRDRGNICSGTQCYITVLIPSEGVLLKKLFIQLQSVLFRTVQRNLVLTPVRSRGRF